MVFVVQLLIYGFHELTEANLFPGSEALHWATEPYGPDGIYGQYLTYCSSRAPWLVAVGDADRREPRSRALRRARQGRVISNMGP